MIEDNSLEPKDRNSGDETSEVVRALTKQAAVEQTEQPQNQSSNGAQNTTENKLESLREYMLTLMRTHTCYELIPESAKVVVFDSKLHIRHAIRALLDHDIKCAPVWDPAQRCFQGMITITDFIQILLETYDDTSTTLHDRLDAMTVGEWSNWAKKKALAPKPHIIGCYPDENIFKAARLLHRHFIHRLPVLQKGIDTSILCILNHQSIMKFLINNIPPNKAHLMSIPVGDLNCGWFENVIFCVDDTPLINCVKLLRNRAIPAVPIINSEGHLLDALSRSDIRFLVADSEIRDTCEKSVNDFIKQHHEGHWIPRCTLADSVHKVITRMLDTRKHSCLITEDDEVTLLGLVTLRNIFAFFFEQDIVEQNTVNADLMPQDSEAQI